MSNKGSDTRETDDENAANTTTGNRNFRKGLNKQVRGSKSGARPNAFRAPSPLAASPPFRFYTYSARCE